MEKHKQLINVDFRYNCRFNGDLNSCEKCAANSVGFSYSISVHVSERECDLDSEDARTINHTQAVHPGFRKGIEVYSDKRNLGLRGR